MNKLLNIINEEISEMKRKGKNLYWTGKNPKGNIETGKKSFARERDMNPETYKLRRQVMDYIYRAKNLLRKQFNYELPRQKIRIIDVDPAVFLAYEGKYIENAFVGCATMGGNDIYIPASSLDGRFDVQGIVYHELLHSAFCMEHNPKSILMSPYVPKLGKYTAEELDNELMKEVEKSNIVEKNNN